MKKMLALAALMGVSTAVFGAATLHGAVPSGQFGTLRTITVGTGGNVVPPIPQLPKPQPPTR